MENPFNSTNQNAEYQFFKSMTGAIDKWMTEKYPGFDQSLTMKINSLNTLQVQAEDSLEYYRNHINSKKNEVLDLLKTQIEEWMTHKYPVLGNQLSVKLLDADAMIKKLEKVEGRFDKMFSEMEGMFKKTKQSKSLVEDVYKIRDEFKEFQQSFSDFKIKMQKLFK